MNNAQNAVAILSTAFSMAGNKQFFHGFMEASIAQEEERVVMEGHDHLWLLTMEGTTVTCNKYVTKGGYKKVASVTVDIRPNTTAADFCKVNEFFGNKA